MTRLEQGEEPGEGEEAEGGSCVVRGDGRGEFAMGGREERFREGRVDHG